MNETRRKPTTGRQSTILMSVFHTVGVKLDCHGDLWLYQGTEFPPESSLVYWGLTPQQQPGSYQSGEMPPESMVQPTTAEEVKRIIKEVDITKSSSIDYISSRVKGCL